MARLLVAVLLAVGLSGPARIDRAQNTPASYPVVVTMDGPGTAVSGEEVTYVIRYRYLAPTLAGGDVIVAMPRHATFVSSQVISGPAAHLPSGAQGGVLRWSLGTPEQPEGAVALTVRIDDSFVGLTGSACYIPGTETNNPEDRCSVDTQVYAPGTLPTAGAGPIGDSGLGSMALLAALGATLVVTGLLLTARRWPPTARY
jgi:hypothetical protein